MFDLISQNKMIQMMDRSMTLSSRRMALVASNLANIDTPQYKTQDFSFQEAFKQEMESLDRQFSPTPGSLQSHFPRAAGASTPTPGNPEGQQYERNDGNDVNLDRETMNLAKTQGTYQISSSIAQSEIRRLLAAIRDGAK
jgi:flagellar basal-body rod protein FlgB